MNTMPVPLKNALLGVGGLLFGVAEAAANYVDSSFGDLYPLIAALIVTAWRPSGLFSERLADVR